MATPTQGIVYEVESRPGFGVLFFLGLQHVLSMASFLVLPVLLASELKATTEQTTGMVQVAMVGCGIGCILLSLRNRWLGSRTLLTSVCANAYFAVTIAAAQTGGLPLVMGMTLVAAGCHIGFAYCIRFFRTLFPPEVTGLVATMVGISFINTVVTNITDSSSAGLAFRPLPLLVGLGTLLAIVGFSVWGRGPFKLFSVLGGAAVGIGLALALGCVPADSVQKLNGAPMIGFSGRPAWGFAFDARFLLPFCVATLASGIKAIGDLTAAQKVAQPDWKRPDFERLTKGVAANGLSLLICGLLGGFPVTASASSVGLALATGAVARRIGLAAGGLLIGLACIPKVAVLFVLLPRPVVGGMLAFVSCFNIVTGMNIMLSRMMDIRRMFVIGLAMAAGLSVELAPKLYKDVPVAFSSLFGSSMALAAFLAIFLHSFFRIGARKERTFPVELGENALRVIKRRLNFLGEFWGARQEAMDRLADVLGRVLAILEGGGFSESGSVISVRYDEFSLDAKVTYSGRSLVLPEPSHGGLGYQFAELKKECDDVRTSSDIAGRHISIRLLL